MNSSDDVTKLLQMSQYTTVMADTGDINTIKSFQLEDATTNPSLIYQAAQNPEYHDLIKRTVKSSHKDDQIIKRLSIAFGSEILEFIQGRVSTEVDAKLAYNTNKTVEYALLLIRLYEDCGVDRSRVLIKIPATWEGIQAAKFLESRDIQCNMTLIFDEVQAKACAQAGAFLISPFVGRITDWCLQKSGLLEYPPVSEDPGVSFVKDVYNLYTRMEYETLVMGASFRHIAQIEALAGCHALTIAPKYLKILSEDRGVLEQQLFSDQAIDERMIASDSEITEEDFKLQMGCNTMASELLSAGISAFSEDTDKMVAYVRSIL